MNLADLGALTLSAAGLLAFLLTLAAMRRFGLALSTALELWTAAGLLRLSAQASWQALATAATLIAVRKLAGMALCVPPPSRTRERADA